MSRARELGDFFVHLRWHYQILILPAGYLLGGLYAVQICWTPFLLQFLNVHLLLNGGVTAYNSYWDRDEGPIGGLERPPSMTPWMHWAALGLQLAGLLLALSRGVVFSAIWVSTMVLSIFYSRPWPRWKGRPVASLFAVGIGTGTNTFLLGYLAAGTGRLEGEVAVAALGAALMLLGVYPVSQIFQLDADRRRKDLTFARAFGLSGVRNFFLAVHVLGTGMVAVTLERRHPGMGWIFLLVSAAGGAFIWWQLSMLRGAADEYPRVMRLKYLASMTFTLFVLASILKISIAP